MFGNTYLNSEFNAGFFLKTVIQKSQWMPYKRDTDWNREAYPSLFRKKGYRFHPGL